MSQVMYKVCDRIPCLAECLTPIPCHAIVNVFVVTVILAAHAAITN